MNRQIEILCRIKNKFDKEATTTEKETRGTVIPVAKQWWLKINMKRVRTHALDGAAFPHIIKVKYTVDNKEYTKEDS